MGIKSFLAKPFAAYIASKVKKDAQRAIADQEKTFNYLIKKGTQTLFGKDHSFGSIHSYDDFKNAVPVRDYEGIKSYIDKAVAGEVSVLWPGKPLYWSKTSGTTSGVKYIPITNDSIHITLTQPAMRCCVT